MLHIKQFNSNKTRFPRFDKILVIWPIAEMYGESNERQLCSEIAVLQATSATFDLNFRNEKLFKII